MSTSVCAAPVTLYQSSLSLDCLKARFLLTLLDVGFETVPMSLDETLPMIAIAGKTCRGANAVLSLIVEEFDSEGRFRDESGWLDFADTELAAVTEARSAAIFGSGASSEQIFKARAALLTLEDALCLRILTGQRWFGENAASLADIAVYPAVALMRDIGLDFEEFPTLRSWLGRMRALAPALSMPGISDIG